MNPPGVCLLDHREKGVLLHRYISKLDCHFMAPKRWVAQIKMTYVYDRFLWYVLSEHDRLQAEFWAKNYHPMTRRNKKKWYNLSWVFVCMYVFTDSGCIYCCCWNSRYWSTRKPLACEFNSCLLWSRLVFWANDSKNLQPLCFLERGLPGLKSCFTPHPPLHSLQPGTAIYFAGTEKFLDHIWFTFSPFNKFYRLLIKIIDSYFPIF